MKTYDEIMKELNYTIYSYVNETDLSVYELKSFINYQKAEIERLQAEKYETVKEYEELKKGKYNIKFKTGDYAKIVNNESGHQFKIGSIVILEKQNEDYKAFDSNDFWWVIDDDLEGIDDNTKIPNI